MSSPSRATKKPRLCTALSTNQLICIFIFHSDSIWTVSLARCANHPGLQRNQDDVLLQILTRRSFQSSTSPSEAVFRQLCDLEERIETHEEWTSCLDYYSRVRFEYNLWIMQKKVNFFRLVGREKWKMYMYIIFIMPIKWRPTDIPSCKIPHL